MPNPLHILYTSNLHGDLEMLPRLHTFIRQLKSLPVDDEDEVMVCAVQPQTPRAFILDLGHACARALLLASRSSRQQAAARTVNGARITKIR